MLCFSSRKDQVLDLCASLLICFVSWATGCAFSSFVFIYTEVKYLDQTEIFPHDTYEIKTWGKEAEFFLGLRQKGCLEGVRNNLQFWGLMNVCLLGYIYIFFSFFLLYSLLLTGNNDFTVIFMAKTICFAFFFPWPPSARRPLLLWAVSDIVSNAVMNLVVVFLFGLFPAGKIN